jgi:hypothetical protein
VLRAVVYKTPRWREGEDKAIIEGTIFRETEKKIFRVRFLGYIFIV